MFAESPALGKELLCRVPEFAESQALGKSSFAECWVWRSAKWIFAECPSFASRQTSTHSAKIQFPVVGKCSPLKQLNYDVRLLEIDNSDWFLCRWSTTVQALVSTVTEVR